MTAEGSDPVTEAEWTVVIPSIGRPSLHLLLECLAAQDRYPGEVLVVDDRPAGGARAPGPPTVTQSSFPFPLRVLRSGGRGPAAARNRGWRAARSPWVVFLDDDVELPPGWSSALVSDLTQAALDVAGVCGWIDVPLPTDRPATDWERSTAGLETAQWATADMAYRRAALSAVAGFDERFPRAYREDADLALRVRQAGWALRRGDRRVTHPVRRAGRWVSLRTQRGNADDALMRALHGRGWRDDAQCPPGALARHAGTVAAAAGAVLAPALLRAVGFSPAARRALATTGAVTWAALAGRFAWERIAPGPRTRREIGTLLATSLAIPPAAVAWRLTGAIRHRGAQPWDPRPLAVLFDRDGTLVHDVPYNGDTAKVRPVDGAREALDRLRAAGLRIGVVTNQSGIALGHFTADDERGVATRIAELLGPFDTWQVCPHAALEGCRCRKPKPGMIRAAMRELGVPPWRTVVIGDTGADVEAALAAGARAILVPTPVTREKETRSAPELAAGLGAAVDRILTAAAPLPFPGSIKQTRTAPARGLLDRRVLVDRRGVS